MTEPMCPDWVLVTNASAHVAKDKAWFTDYTEFDSEILGTNETTPLPVLGVGTVHLKLKAAPDGGEHTLELHDVLHVPSSICNMVVLGLVDPPVRHEYGESNGRTQGSIRDEGGRQIGYFDPNEKLYQLKPSGPAVGPSSMRSGYNYVIGNRWSDARRRGGRRPGLMPSGGSMLCEHIVGWSSVELPC